MMRALYLLTVWAVISLCGGCAGVRHFSVEPHADAQADGVRYYRSSPYLFVYFNAKGERLWKILSLPDPTQKMTVRPYNVLAKVETSLTFVNGVLTESTDLVDATALPKAIVQAIEKVLPLLLAAPLTPPGQQPEPTAYKIIVHGNKVWLKGTKTVQIL